MGILVSFNPLRTMVDLGGRQVMILTPKGPKPVCVQKPLRNAISIALRQEKRKMRIFDTGP